MSDITIETTTWPNGALKSRERYKEGEHFGLQEFYFDNGMMAQCGFCYKGKNHGIWINYNYYGNVTYVENYVLGNQNGMRISYFKSGLPSSVENYLDGLEHGESITYDMDGVPEFVGVFREGNPWSGVCKVSTWNREEGYGYYALFEEGIEVRRITDVARTFDVRNSEE